MSRANLDSLRYLSEILSDPRRFADIDTSAQEIWMEWSATMGSYRRLALPDALAPLVGDLDRAIRTLTDKHPRDSASKVMSRSDWPAVQRAAERLLDAVRAIDTSA